MKDRRRLRPGSAWLLGLAVGLAGTLLTIEVGVLGLLLYAFMVLTLVSTRSAAPFGAASMTTGLWFLFAWRQSLAWCDAVNATGSGSCEIYDAWIGGAIAAGFFAVGVALSVYGLRGRP